MRLCVICGRELPEGRDLTCVACELVVGRQTALVLVIETFGQRGTR